MSTATINKTDKLELFSDAGFEEKQGVSQAKYARMRNRTRQNVSKHVKNGIITLLPNGNIDPEFADEELADKLDPAHTQGNKGTESCAPTNGNGNKGNGQTESFHDVKKKKEVVQMDLLALELKRKTGELINKKRAEVAYASKITAVVRRLQKISKRISPAIAKENDRIKCEGMIHSEIKEAVEEFGENIHRKGAKRK